MTNSRFSIMSQTVKQETRKSNAWSNLLLGSAYYFTTLLQNIPITSLGAQTCNAQLSMFLLLLDCFLNESYITVIARLKYMYFLAATNCLLSAETFTLSP